MKRGACVVLFAFTFLSISVYAAEPVTFSKDVAPILYNSCVGCHRTGEIAPMSLISYEEVRPWAKSIQKKVASREMPPWGANPEFGTFKDDPEYNEAMRLGREYRLSQRLDYENEQDPS